MGNIIDMQHRFNNRTQKSKPELDTKGFKTLYLAKKRISFNFSPKGFSKKS